MRHAQRERVRNLIVALQKETRPDFDPVKMAVLREMLQIKLSRDERTPHQGKRECARRLAQRAKGMIP